MLKKKIGINIIILLSFVFLTSCTLDSSQQSNINQTIIKEMNTSNYYSVEEGTIKTTLIGSGKIVPTKTTSLYFNNVSGPLESLIFGLNDQVKKDDLFAEITPTDIQNRIESQRIVVEKGKARLQFLNATPSNTDQTEISIELLQLELEALLEKQKSLPIENDLSLQKAQLAVKQLQTQFKSSSLSLDLAELDWQQDQGSVEKIKIHIEQIENNIASAKTSVDQQQEVYDNLVKNGASEDDKKLAKLRLDQLQLDLANIEKSKKIAQLDLDIAISTQNSKESGKSKEGLTKSEIRLEQANLALESIQQSIDIATLTLEQTSKSNDEKVKSARNEIKKYKKQLEKLKMQLASQINSNVYEKLQAEYDQQIAEMTLQVLEENLENSKLYSPVDGIVSQLSNFSITDIIGSGQLLAKIADPSKLVFQLSATDAQYVTDASRAVLTIGTEKYNVEFYTPQPGDSFLQNSTMSYSNVNNNASNLYVKFTDKMPELKFEEIVQAQLEVEKDNVLQIPKSYVRVENGKILVDLLKDKEIVTTEIVRGIESDMTVEVMNGLKLGDQILIR